MSDDWTEGDVSALLSNPFYAINIDPALAEPHEPMVSEEEWIGANVNQIKELGPEAYLRNLLSVLQGNLPLVPLLAPNQVPSATSPGPTKWMPTGSAPGRAPGHPTNGRLPLNGAPRRPLPRLHPRGDRRGGTAAH